MWREKKTGRTWTEAGKESTAALAEKAENSRPPMLFVSQREGGTPTHRSLNPGEETFPQRSALRKGRDRSSSPRRQIQGGKKKNSYSLCLGKQRSARRRRASNASLPQRQGEGKASRSPGEADALQPSGREGGKREGKAPMRCGTHRKEIPALLLERGGERRTNFFPGCHSPRGGRDERR